MGIGLDHGIIGLEQPPREGMIDLGQAVLAIVGQQADGLGAGQFLGHGQVAPAQLDGRELEPDLGKVRHEATDVPVMTGLTTRT